MDELAELIATVEEHTVDDHIGRHGWGVVAKKLLKWLRYFMARCRLWKQAAKKNRARWLAILNANVAQVNTYETILESYREVLHTATRRKKLLRRCQAFLELTERYIPGDVFYTTNLHDELEEELKNE